MIGKNKDCFVLRLNSLLYEKNSVKDAFEELKKNVDASLEKGSYFVIKVKKSKKAEKYCYEFLNYVLKLMMNKGVV